MLCKLYFNKHAYKVYERNKLARQSCVLRDLICQEICSIGGSGKSQAMEIYTRKLSQMSNRNGDLNQESNSENTKESSDSRTDQGGSIGKISNKWMGKV